MAKRIQLHGDLLTNPILKTGNRSLGVSLSQAPTANVTVIFDSVSDYFTHTATLTFTTSNWFTPQTLTITGVTDAAIFGLRKDTLSALCSGGGYDGVSTTKEVIVYDSGIDIKFLTGFRWINEVSVSSANVVTKRQAFIDRIFPTGFPTNSTPSSSVIGYTGTSIHAALRANITGYTSINKYTFTSVDGDGDTWSHIVYHFIVGASPSENLIIEHFGHGSEGGTTHETMINRILSEGYDCLVCAMPIGTNCDNTEDNTTVNGTGTGGHGTILTGGLDTVDYLPLQLFFFATIEALNYLDANYSYSNYYAIGLSGGGYSVTLLSALDSRIKHTFCDRGVKPRSFKVAPDTTVEPDYEQGGTPTSSVKCGPRVYSVFTDYPYIDIILMAMYGGRKYTLLTHDSDPEGLGGFTYKIWSEKAQEVATSLGGEYALYYNPNAGQSAHAYQPAEIDHIFSVL